MTGDREFLSGAGSERVLCRKTKAVSKTENVPASEEAGHAMVPVTGIEDSRSGKIYLCLTPAFLH